MTIPSDDIDTPSAFDGRCILIVEDEVLIAMDLTDAFESAGARVHYARTLRQGLSMAESEPIDAALLDVNLGRGQNCAPIVEVLEGRGVPFALHSGDLERQGELVSSIRAPLVKKPNSISNVVDAVAGLLPE